MAPAVDHSGVIASASFWPRPSTHGTRGMARVVARARHDVQVRQAERLRRVAHRADVARIRHRGLQHTQMLS
ncbi:hypothetical protein WK24_05050 [Burkholderia vietnamiensis]|nr:hypothetical protein WK23_06770 [Burkholderia vietnamiensis]KVF36687.1 hypothetical protein WJ09_06835 [Burkholderia vietnamiensis]KVF99131.1 hypothetical protein WJ21_13340 [Burkholderia vietnamiensis]KVR75925.1 hypothetical protein WK24_05050 [Burkholderia vietnamiensis]